MKYTATLQIAQVKELIYLECKKQGIVLASEDNGLDAILDGGAELILASNGPAKDPREVLDWIDDWINDTRQNYPSYFLKGVC